jgi:hypothetical protein
MATAPASQPALSQPAASQAAAATPPAANVASSSVKLANMTSLYSDKLTDAAHEH